MYWVSFMQMVWRGRLGNGKHLKSKSWKYLIHIVLQNNKSKIISTLKNRVVLLQLQQKQLLFNEINKTLGYIQNETYRLIVLSLKTYNTDYKRWESGTRGVLHWTINALNVLTRWNVASASREILKLSLCRLLFLYYRNN